MTRRMLYVCVLLGLGAYLAFAAATLPAATAFRYFGPSGVRLMGIKGTIWSGGAALGSTRGLALHDIQWDIEGLKLLSGRLAGHVRAKLSNGFLDTELSARPGSLFIGGLRASTNLASLDGVLPLAGIRGNVSLAFDELVLDNGRPSAAEGSVRIAGLAVPPLVGGSGAALLQLGNYEIDFESSGKPGIAAHFHDTGGPLQVSGTLSLDAQGRYAVAGFVAPRATAQPELVQGLKFFTGNPDAKGRRSFSLSGSI